MAGANSPSSTKASSSELTATTTTTTTAAAAAAAATTSSSASSSTSPTPEPSTTFLPDPKIDLPAYLLKLQSALQPLTRNAAAIPSHGDLAFHRSMDRKLAKRLDSESDRVIQSISQLASWIASDSRAPKIPLAKSSSSSEVAKKNAKTKLDIQLDCADVTGNESFASNLGELVDHLLESADTCLDEYSGKLAPRNLANHGGIEENAVGAVEKGLTGRLQAMTAVQNGKALPKTGNLPSWVLNAPIPSPQKNFTTKPDNSADTPWQPRLKYGKPNAQVPLGHHNPARLGIDGKPLPRGPRRGMYCAEGDPLDNPYYHEISHSDPPTHALTKPEAGAKETPPPALNEKDPSLSTDACPFVWVSTKAQIEALQDHLDEERVKEIAIDLEHHSYRTYQGIVCLMQLSTRWGDWIIDTLSEDVRQHAEVLNSSFTNPDKVKVLHGANHDVLWLQRDLGLYLVNLFDTYHATNVLMFPSHGLNYLMARYCNFDADKRYQLADWRIRPLPKEMLYYARSDTHTLLYIYDNLRHELMEAGGVDAIREVFHRSKDVAMATYAKEEWDSEGESREGWRSVWRKWGGEAAIGTEDRKELKHMKREERLVRALHKWRDGVAREEDESPRYILGANNMMMLASRAPVKPEGVLACVPPNATGLKKRVGELAKLIDAEVKAWEEDQEKKREDKKQKLAARLLANEKDVEMDVGETIAREEAAPVEATMQEEIPVKLASISAISNVASTDPKVDVSIWFDFTNKKATSAPAAPAPEPAPAAATQSGIRGAVRSFASNLFGRSTPTTTTSITAAAAPALQRTLSSTTSKLFGSASTRSAPQPRGGGVGAKIDAVKAGFVGQVGGFLGGFAPASAFAQDVEMLAESEHPERDIPSGTINNAAFSPSASLATNKQDHPMEQDDDVSDDSSSEKQDFIVVSSNLKSKSKSKSKGQKAKQASDTFATIEERMTIKKELKKKRKAEAAAVAAAGDEVTASVPAKKRKEKFEGEFDFSLAPNGFESAKVNKSEERAEKDVFKKNNQKHQSQVGSRVGEENNNKKKKEDGKKVDEKVFRQPRDRARRKTGMGSTM
ncbi:related to RRP6 - Exonuclease component of the nuclear exosome [Melanopsichium pennsylvanicum]|uniref:Related to RRP6 - Exonuclease component of the nuclear exosome n=2 Tax=Melanopsichium pennsylvanicum TaxID=63383 RepID=A0AAJ5C883_9BASI|nr:related to RRP6-Exonuclease component of the nuclear exosome [Melanopsichium pennsylvanicum 4]SNX87735.1 related to RRP6 - Exonuclease component of the nuclear exosome [Melanopsichium pennsylvanicum]